MRTFEVYFAFFLCMPGIVLVTSDDDYQEFYDELLKLHNLLRKKHDAGDLILDNALSVIAKERAENLLNGKIGIPRDDWTYGKNFFGRSVLHENMPNAMEVFTNWYHEIEKHDYDKDPITDNTASFTQIVWKSTTNLGLAMVRDPHYVMVVAIYKPPGNIEGEYAANVSKWK